MGFCLTHSINDCPHQHTAALPIRYKLLNSVSRYLRVTFSLDQKLMEPNAPLNNATQYLAGANIGKGTMNNECGVKRFH